MTVVVEIVGDRVGTLMEFEELEDNVRSKGTLTGLSAAKKVEEDVMVLISLVVKPVGIGVGLGRLVLAVDVGMGVVAGVVAVGVGVVVLGVTALVVGAIEGVGSEEGTALTGEVTLLKDGVGKRTRGGELLEGVVE